MRDDAPLKEALLDLGLEDLIALPEIASASEVRDVLDPGQEAVEDISAALVELLREGRIQVWAAYWPQEPSLVGEPSAELVLRDLRRFAFHSEPTGVARAYYVNVDNLRA